MTADFPTERWFWFQPPFHGGQSALLHKQPDDVWRIDLQLGRDADARGEAAGETWCRASAGCLATMPSPSNGSPSTRFSVGVSPASSTAASSSRATLPIRSHPSVRAAPIPASRMRRTSPGSWRSFSPARPVPGSSRPMTSSAARRRTRTSSTPPARRTSSHRPRPRRRRLRDAVLALAAEAPFARRLVNSGRLSVPTTYGTPLTTPDEDGWGGSARLGAPVPDLPLLRPGHGPTHLTALASGRFALLTMGEVCDAPADSEPIVMGRDVLDAAGLFSQRFDAGDGAGFLLRPGRAPDRPLATADDGEGRTCDPARERILNQGLG